jgi:hypothetical protein
MPVLAIPKLHKKQLLPLERIDKSLVNIGCRTSAKADEKHIYEEIARNNTLRGR